MNTHDVKIHKIVEEILHLEPALRSSEAQVRAAVEALLALEPDTEPSAAFVARLRTKLLVTEQKQHSFPFFSSFMNKQTTSLILVPSLAALLLVVGVGAYYLRAPGTGLVERGARVAIVDLQPGAFGSLLGASPGASAVPAPQVAETVGASGVTDTVSPRMAATGFAGGDTTAMVTSKMIAPAVMYTYTYEGGDIVVEDEALPVFRRNKMIQASGSNIFGVVSRLFPGVNLSPLSDARIQNINFVQDKKDGFTAFVDFDDARVSIGPNYVKWYGADVCGPTPCNQNPLSEADVPSEIELIRLANAFIEEYKIDRSMYGEPIVDFSWKAVPIEASARYIPDTVSVIYPLVLGDKKIMESYGTAAYGLRVNVDIRKNKVQGAWNITGGTYERSNYALETNPERLKKFAENGGYIGGPIYFDTMGQTTKTLRLGTPEIVYEQQYLYNDETQTSQELYVPTLSFPVINSHEAEGYVPTFIRVPLAKELLDSRENPVTPGGGPVLMMREVK